MGANWLFYLQPVFWCQHICDKWLRQLSVAFLANYRLRVGPIIGCTFGQLSANYRPIIGQSLANYRLHFWPIIGCVFGQLWAACLANHRLRVWPIIGCTFGQLDREPSKADNQICISRPSNFECVWNSWANNWPIIGGVANNWRGCQLLGPSASSAQARPPGILFYLSKNRSL